MRNRTEICAPALLAVACGFHDPVADDVGEAGYCKDVAEWEGDWSELELDLIQEVNAARGRGGACGDVEIDFRVELDLSPELRCAARKQVRDMARVGELSHTGVDRSEFVERADMADYAGIPRAELLAVGYADAPATIEQWRESQVHCESIHAGDHDDVGAGVFQTQDTLWWVLTLGTRRE